jgi:hypothetical protein
MKYKETARRARGEHHRVLMEWALTCAFRSFSTIRTFPGYAAESLQDLPATAVNMRVLIDSLASADAVEIAPGSQVSEVTISEAMRPLADAGWEHTVDGRWARWQAPGVHSVGVRFDAFAAWAHHGALPTWTFWGGGDANSPRWALLFSPHAAASVLTALPRGLHAESRADIRAQLAPCVASARTR